MNSLSKRSDKDYQGQLVNSDSGLEISRYNDELTPSNILVQMKRLSVAFPKQSPEFFNLLAERIASNGFTDKRLNDAVNNLLDNFSYKELNLSDIIKFDKRVKLYTYSDVCKMVTKGEVLMSDFEIYRIGDQCFRIKKTDKI